MEEDELQRLVDAVFKDLVPTLESHEHLVQVLVEEMDRGPPKFRRQIRNILLTGIKSGDYDRRDAENFLRFVDGDVFAPPKFHSVRSRMPTSTQANEARAGDIEEVNITWSSEEEVVLEAYEIPAAANIVTTHEEVIHVEPEIERVVQEEVVEPEVIQESAAVHLSNLFFKLQWAQARQKNSVMNAISRQVWESRAKESIVRMNASRMINELRRAVHFNLGSTFTRWFNNVERAKSAKIKQSAEYRSLDHHMEIRHLMSKAQSRIHYEKQHMFDRWARVIAMDNDEILDTITSQSDFMVGIPSLNRRQILRSGRRPDKDMSSLMSRLHQIANDKLTTRSRSLERWQTSTTGLKERIRLNTTLDLAATRISDILKSRLKSDFWLIQQANLYQPQSTNFRIAKEFAEKYQKDQNSTSVQQVITWLARNSSRLDAVQQESLYKWRLAQKQAEADEKINSFTQKFKRVSSGFQILERKLSPRLKQSFSKLNSGRKKRLEGGLNRLSVIMKERQRVNIALWKHKTAQSKLQEWNSKLLIVLLRYNTRLLAKRNAAWGVFKQPLKNLPYAKILAEKFKRISLMGLRNGFEPLLELRLASRARAMFSLMNIANQKEATQKAKAIQLWSRRGILTVLRRLSLQATDRKRQALHHWVIRTLHQSVIDTKTTGVESSAAIRVKGMSLVVLNKLYRRPFNKQRAWRRWSVNWRFLMKKIVYLMAIQASINEQVAWWRWKRLIFKEPEKTPPVSNLVFSAQSVQGLINASHMLNLIIAKRPKMAMNAMQKCRAYPMLVRNAIRKVLFIQKAMMQRAMLIWSSKKPFKDPFISAQNVIKVLTKSSDVLREAFHEIRAYDKHRWSKALRRFMIVFRILPRTAIQRWKQQLIKSDATKEKAQIDKELSIACMRILLPKQQAELTALRFAFDRIHGRRFSLWAGKEEASGAFQAARNLTMVLLKDHGAMRWAFYNLRKHPFDESIDGLKQENLEKHKKVNAAVVGWYMQSSTMPVLRLAFDKIYGPSRRSQRPLGSLALIMKQSTEARQKDAIARLWRNWALGKLNQGIKTETLNTGIFGGIQKLKEVLQHSPKKAIRSMQKKKQILDRVADQLKKVSLLYDMRLQKAFLFWKGRGKFKSGYTIAQKMVKVLSISSYAMKVGFEAMKVWDPQRIKRAVGLMMILLRVTPRSAMFEWYKTSRQIFIESKDRNMHLKLLSWLANIKPHVYFLLWKNNAHNISINDLKSKIALTSIFQGLGKLGNVNCSALRFSFNKIRDHDPNMEHQALRHLMLVASQRPRQMLRLWAKTAKQEEILELKCDVGLQKKKKKKLKAGARIQKPIQSSSYYVLRLAFDKILGPNKHDILRRLMVALNANADRTLRNLFFLWNKIVKDQKHQQETLELNLNINLQKKHKRIVMASGIAQKPVESSRIPVLRLAFDKILDPPTEKNILRNFVVLAGSIQIQALRVAFFAWRLKASKKQLKNKTKIALAIGNLHKSMTSSQVPLLRLAFDKLLAPSNVPLLQRVLVRMQNSHDNAVRHALRLWTITNLDEKLQKEKTENGSLRLKQAVLKLYKPLKVAIHHMKFHDSDKTKRAIRRLMFVLPKNLRLCLAIWKNGAVKKHQAKLEDDVAYQRQNTNIVLASGNLLSSIESAYVPILRLAFDKILGPQKEEITRRLLVAINSNHDRSLRNCFFLWKIHSKDTAHKKEIERKDTQRVDELEELEISHDKEKKGLMKSHNFSEGFGKLDKVKNNKLRAGNDKLKANDPNDKLRAIRKIMLIAPKVPKSEIALWKAKTDDIREEEAKRSRSLNIWNRVVNSWPGVYFLLWKRLVNEEKIDNLKTDIQESKTKRRITLAAVTMSKPVQNSQLPVLRLAFDKILGQNSESLLRPLLVALDSNHQKIIAPKFSKWKFMMFKRKMDEGMAVLAKRPNILDGAQKLLNISLLGPRSFFWNMVKNQTHQEKWEKATKALMLIFNKSPRLCLWRWKDAARDAKEQELLQNTAIEKRHKQVSLGSGKVLPTLLRTRLPILLLAFQKIMGLPKQDILRRLMVALNANADRAGRNAFFLWKQTTEGLKHAEETLVLNEDIKLQKKHKRIVMASGIAQKPVENSRIPVLRLAFDKILDPPTEKNILRNFVVLAGAIQNKSLRIAFFAWRLKASKKLLKNKTKITLAIGNLHKSIQSSQAPILRLAFDKLLAPSNVPLYRKVLVRMQNSHDNAVRHVLRLWANATLEDKLQNEKAENSSLRLKSAVQKLYKPLKIAMHHMKFHDSDKTKRAIRRLMFVLPKNLRLCLAIWKNGAVKKHEAKLEGDVAISRQNTNIAMGSGNLLRSIENAFAPVLRLAFDKMIGPKPEEIIRRLVVAVNSNLDRETRKALFLWRIFNKSSAHEEEIETKEQEYEHEVSSLQEWHDEEKKVLIKRRKFFDGFLKIDKVKNNKLRSGNDKLKGNDPNDKRRAIRKIILIAPKVPKSGISLWKAKTDDIREEEAKRSRSLKIWNRAVNAWPHVYFLLWKRLVTQDKIDNLKTDIQESKAKRRITMAAVTMSKPVQNSQLPILRLAFDKILGQDSESLLRPIIVALGSNHQKVIAPMFSLWKFKVYKHRMDEGMAVLAKRPNILDGAQKLFNLSMLGPRSFFWNMAKNQTHQEKWEKATKQLLLIFNKSPRLCLWRWKDAARDAKEQELLQNTAMEKRHKQVSLGSGKVLPTLLRTRLPILLLAFQKIMGLPKQDILRRLMVALNANADRTTRNLFFLWKEAIEGLKHAEETLELNENIKLQKKHKRIAMASGIAQKPVENSRIPVLRLAFDKILDLPTEKNIVRNFVVLAGAIQNKALRVALFRWRLMTSKVLLKNRALIALASGNLHNSLQSSQIPLLRLAFDKLLAPSNVPLLQRVLVRMQNSHDNAVHHALRLWAFNTLDDKLRLEKAESSALRLKHAVQKLYKPLRVALHHIKDYDSDLTKRAIRRLMFVLPKNLRLCLAVWKNGAVKKHEAKLEGDVAISRQNTNIALGSGNLLRSIENAFAPVLRLAFDKIIGPKKEEIIRRVVVAINSNLDRGMRRALFLWRIFNKNIAHDEEIEENNTQHEDEIEALQEWHEEEKQGLEKRRKLFDGFLKLDRVKNNKLRAANDKLKGNDPNDKRRAIRKIMLIAPKVPKSAISIWKAKTDDIREEEAKRNRSLKIWSRAVNAWPHVYFLLWKRLVTQDKIENLKTDIQESKTKRRITLAAVTMSKPVQNSQLPVLRLAFDKILGKDSESLLRPIIVALGSNHHKIIAPAFSNWKLKMYKVRMDEGMAVLAKRPNILDGAQKLFNLSLFGPRSFFWNMTKNKMHQEKWEKATKLLMLIFNKSPRLYLWLWKDATRDAKEQELLQNTAMEKKHKQISLGSGKVLPTLLRTRLPILRLAFQKIMGLPKQDILRRLMVALNANADRAQRNAFFLWKQTTEGLKHAEETLVLNEDIKLQKKHKRIAMASGIAQKPVESSRIPVLRLAFDKILSPPTKENILRNFVVLTHAITTKALRIAFFAWRLKASKVLLKNKTKIALAIGNLHKSMTSSQVPLLRIAFDKLIAPSREPLLGRVLVRMQNSHDNAVRHALRLWALATIDEKLHLEKASHGSLRLRQAVLKLYKPLKIALHHIQSYDSDVEKRAMRRLMFVLPKNLRLCLALWKNGAQKKHQAKLEGDLVSQERCTNIALGSGKLLSSIEVAQVPVLRLAFDKIMGPKKEEITRRLLVAINSNHDRNLRNYIFLWKLFAKETAHKEEIDAKDTAHKKEIDENNELHYDEKEALQEQHEEEKKQGLIKQRKFLDGALIMDKVKNNKVRAGNDKLKENDPNVQRRAIRKMMMFLPHDLRAYLLLWKSQANKDKVADMQNTIETNEDKYRIALASENLKSPISLALAPFLRLAFNALAKPSDEPTLRKGITNIDGNHKKIKANKLFLWKMLVLRDKINNKETLIKQKIMIDGVMKLEKVKNNGPRRAVNQMRKAKTFADKKDTAIRKLMFLIPKNLKLWLTQWKNGVNEDLKDELKADISLQKRHKKIAVGSGHMVRPIRMSNIPMLRLAFDKILGPKKEEITRRLLIVLNANHDRNLRNLFALWKLFANDDKHNIEKQALAQHPNFVDGMMKLDKVKNNKLRAGNNKLKENDPDEKRRAIRKMLLFLGSSPRAYLLLWKSRATEIREFEAKKNNAYKFLAKLAHIKVNVYFLLWKRIDHLDTLEELNNDIVINKKKTKIALGSSKAQKTMQESQIPLLRLAFDKLVMPSKEPLLRRALNLIVNSHLQALRASLLSWKITDLDKKNEEEKANSKKLKLKIGVDKLQEVQNLGLKIAIHRLFLLKTLKEKSDSSLRNLVIIQKKTLLAVFYRWAGKESFSKNYSKAELIMRALTMHIRRLKFAFDKINKNTKLQEKVKEAIHRFRFIVRADLTRSFAIWAKKTSFPKDFQNAEKLLSALNFTRGPLKDCFKQIIASGNHRRTITMSSIRNLIKTFLTQRPKQALSTWRKNSVNITQSNINRKKAMTMLNKVAKSKPQQVINTWKRQTNIKKTKLTNILHKMQTTIIYKKRTAFVKMYQKAKHDKILYTNAMWRWRTCNLTGVLHNVFKIRMQKLRLTLRIEKVFNIFITRSKKYFISQIRISRTPVANMVKFLARAMNINLSKGLLQWKAIASEERAIEWETRFAVSATIHPFYTNLAKIQARIDMRDIIHAFATWSFSPLKRMEAGLQKVQRLQQISQKDYLNYWRLISRSDTNNIRSQIVHRLGDIMKELNMKALNNALYIWADRKRDNLAYKALVLFAKKVDRSITIFFNLWSKNVLAMKHKKLANLGEGAKILNSMLEHKLQANLKQRIVTWKSAENNNPARRVLARFISNWNNNLKLGWEQWCEGHRRYIRMMQGAGAHLTMNLLRRDRMLIQKRSFDKWKANEANRKFIVKQKSAMSWMMKMKTTYQSCFWRWKFITSSCTRVQLFPQHSIMMKRLYHIFNQADIRRYTHAFLKILHCGEIESSPMSASRYERLHIQGRSSVETPISGQTPISGHTPMSLQTPISRLSPTNLRTPQSLPPQGSPGVSIIENEFETNESNISFMSIDPALPMEQRRAATIKLFLGCNEMLMKNLYSTFGLIKALSLDKAYQKSYDQLRVSYISMESPRFNVPQNEDLATKVEALRFSRLVRVIELMMKARQQEAFIYCKVYSPN